MMAARWSSAACLLSGTTQSVPKSLRMLLTVLNNGAVANVNFRLYIFFNIIITAFESLHFIFCKVNKDIYAYTDSCKTHYGHISILLTLSAHMLEGYSSHLVYLSMSVNLSVLSTSDISDCLVLNLE